MEEILYVQVLHFGKYQLELVHFEDILVVWDQVNMLADVEQIAVQVDVVQRDVIETPLKLLVQYYSAVHLVWAVVNLIVDEDCGLRPQVQFHY
jgi:hypothetical protein